METVGEELIRAHSGALWDWVFHALDAELHIDGEASGRIAQATVDAFRQAVEEWEAQS